VLYVDVGTEAFSALPNEVLAAAQTLHELVQEWLPDARTRMVLASGDRNAPAPDRGSALRATLAAIPDVTPVRVDIRARQVTVGGEPVRLTPTEFDLLAALLRAQGQVVTREELHATVWRGRPVRESSRTVDVHVRRLRAIPALAELVTTARGVGYRIPVRPHLHVTI
jgi:DNA-binding response OmpR family regulator